jgi:hypothetical protein
MEMVSLDEVEETLDSWKKKKKKKIKEEKNQEGQIDK